LMKREHLVTASLALHHQREGAVVMNEQAFERIHQKAHA